MLFAQSFVPVRDPKTRQLSEVELVFPVEGGGLKTLSNDEHTAVRNSATAMEYLKASKKGLT